MPDTRERLETAALELFAEKGYEGTTAAQIAARAGVNRATFFRHFADKREVLFGGDDVLADLFVVAIQTAPAGATLTDYVQAAVASADKVMNPQQRIKSAQRLRVLAVSTEVQERGLLKQARTARSVGDALRQRGMDELTARLGAQMTMLVFSVTMEHWMQAEGQQPFSSFAATAFNAVRKRLNDFVLRSDVPSQ